MRSDRWAARCVELVKTYRTPTGEVRALRGISVDFGRGALTAVVGPSGSGKSTLLRLLSGMDRPTHGGVEVQGAQVKQASGGALRRLRRHRVGYVFQRPSDNLLPYLTVEQHLRLASRRRSGGPAIDADELVRRLGVGHRLRHLPVALSGGEQQRVAFAQSVLAGASLVVADEPTAELDTASAAEVLHVTRSLVSAGITVIVATHDPALRSAADGVVELEHGRLRERGARQRPETLLVFPGRRSGMPDRPEAGPRGARPLLLEVEDLRKTYRRGTELVQALKDVTFVLSVGEIAGIVGRSGSGKTTLLNVIGGWEEADGGRVRWVDPGAPRGVPRWHDLAVLPQRFGLLDELTVRENIEYPARVAGRLEETREAVAELLDALGLDDFQGRYPRETSVGEQQRTALARALVLSPRLVLADEPTGHQDEQSTAVVLAVLTRAAARGTTCLVATHNERLAGHFDRVLPMGDGRLTARGEESTDDSFRQPPNGRGN